MTNVYGFRDTLKLTTRKLAGCVRRKLQLRVWGNRTPFMAHSQINQLATQI